MRNLGKGLLAVLVLTLLIAGPNLVGVLPSQVDDVGDTRGPEPLSDGEPMWSDKLDDLSHVYTPDGLVDVEVTGGEARLVAGEDEGYIASEVIRAEPGYNFNLVYLDAVVPGNSSIEISILNAAKESSVVGYANATVPGFAKKVCTDRSLTTLGCVAYPAIRIQVNLNADGTDRPTLLGWHLYYVPHGEWRDEFLGTGKLSSYRNLNFTEGNLEIDLSRGTSAGAAGYDPYPLIAGAQDNDLDLIYGNSGGTGYDDPTQLGVSTSRGVCFDDLDLDGDLDMVVTDQSSTSRIYWNDGTDTYSTSNKEDLTTDAARRPATGDLNGDGWPDLAFACGGDGDHSSSVFLSQEGSFDSQPDIVFTDQEYSSAQIGDLDSDGYEDLVFGDRYIFYGGPEGPGTTADVTIDGYYSNMKDMDGDGILDIIICDGSNVKIYLGTASGPSATPAYTLSATSYVYYPDAGDFNGDGYLDIVAVVSITSSEYKINIFEGGPDGWKSSRMHEDIVHAYRYYRSMMADIDLDGYDDILICRYEYDGDYSFHIDIFNGGSSWPTTPTTTIDLSRDWNDLALAIPKGVTDRRAFKGVLVTEPINLPVDKKWDMMHLEGTFPANTSISLDVLDASNRLITSMKDLKDLDIDLSFLDPSAYPTIAIRVVIATEFNNTTPALDRMTVRWMNLQEWREQFYGVAKIDRYIGVGVAEGVLKRSTLFSDSPQLLVPSQRWDGGYDADSLLYVDSGGLDYLTREPMTFNTRGVSAASTALVNDDGFLDVLFAVHRTSVGNYAAKSPLYLNSPFGWKSVPDNTFPTTGATDVVMEDINGDGFVDVVFAQEQDGTTFHVNSTLFWGSATGWSSTPDVTFATTGASDVEVVDVDGDTRLDLVFACFRDSSTTATDSMVFLQGATGFDGTTPDHLLATSGARGVASGDIDDDGHVDLVFANSRSGGLTEIDSYVYWGKAGGGFATGPKRLPTMGAQGVAVADLDGNGDLDIVFANEQDNSQDYSIDSYVYLGDGTRGLPGSPDVRLPTTGAVSVGVMDLDGTGWKDLAFACQFDGESYEVPSRVYLGGASGWASTPDILLPTVGASDVLAVQMFEAGQGGYRSTDISLTDHRKYDVFHTFKYTASLGPGQSGTLQFVDSDTAEVLAETMLMDGTNSWYIGDQFLVKDHSSIQVVVVVQGLDASGAFALDDLWLNWTLRVEELPRVLGMELTSTIVYRTRNTRLVANVTDEYDDIGELTVEARHRLNGSADQWKDHMFGDFDLVDDQWQANVVPNRFVPVGKYDVQVTVWDTDGGHSEWMLFPEALEVLNNLPSAPEVMLTPEEPLTDVNLYVEIVTSSVDVEIGALTYHYRWYKDGVLYPEVEDDHLPSEHTTKGENWSVEVRAFDGDDEGLPAMVWRVIANAPPRVFNDLPDPEFPEDTVDTDWLDLSTAFFDPDGDVLEFTLDTTPEHMEVTIDPGTGMVTLAPEADWFGEVVLKFWATDGEFDTSQSVNVTVLSVNDIPVIGTVDGKAYTGGAIEYTIRQGETLTITYEVVDVEGDELVATIASQSVTHDPIAGTIIFAPQNNEVGTLNFTLTVHDTVSPDQKVTIDFTIVVENENDPMTDPTISTPASGAEFKVNKSFMLTALCDDPDLKYGQELNFTWESNISGVLGYGSSLTVELAEPGLHRITLTVRDPDFTKSVWLDVLIKPKRGSELPPPPDDDDTTDGTNWVLLMGIVVALVVLGAVLFLVGSKRRTERIEEEEEAAFDAETKRDALERTRDALKDTADEWEEELELSRAQEEAPAEIEMTGTTGTQLSMQATISEGDSEEVEGLFTGAEAAEPVMSEEEQDQLRLDNDKRKYQNAIGRLPYGIPSKELQELDWVDLADALATGPKKLVHDGQEITGIDGRWYFSDADDSSTFLKEHGAKVKEVAKPIEPTMDNEALLKKLEERFIMGEISEESYQKLVKKYGE